MDLKKKKWDKILEEIYRNVIYDGDDITRREKRLVERANKLLAPYENQYSEKQMEEIRAVIYDIIFATEAKAFRLGARYVRGLLSRL